MITHYYVNGKQVKVEDYLDAEVQEINQKIIGDLNLLIKQKALEYYEKRPDEKPEPDSNVVYEEFNGELFEAYSQTEEGKKVIDDFLRRHPFTTAQKEAGKTFWFYLIFSLISLIIGIAATCA